MCDCEETPEATLLDEEAKEIIREALGLEKFEDVIDVDFPP